MSSPSISGSYKQALQGAISGEVPHITDYFLERSLSRSDNPFLYLASIQEAIENDRDYAPPALVGTDTPMKTPELVRFTLSAAGFVSTDLVPERTFPRHHASEGYIACHEAEWCFADILQKDFLGVRAIVWRDDNGNPVFLQKGIGEKTALSLVPVGVTGRSEKISYPPGWLFVLKQKRKSAYYTQQSNMFRSLHRTLAPGSSRVVSHDADSLSAVRPIRMTAFAPQTQRGRAYAKKYAEFSQASRMPTLEAFQNFALQNS